MKYALGPILYYWPNQQIEEFYHLAKASSADIIYIGETVCSKRRNMKANDWIDLAKQLHQAGKQVVISTMALLEAPSEVRNLKKLIDNGDFIIEANDFSAIEEAHNARLPFVCGPAINIYNAYALNVLLKQGMQRWVMPVELSRDWLQKLVSECNEMGIRDRFEIEVFAYGHLPLAYSARCFTAQSEGKSKDDCETCCIKYPNGRQVDSQEGQSLFVLNGIQTMSGDCYNLINDQQSMQGLVDIVRISPTGEESIEHLEAFRRRNQSTEHFPTPDSVNGYWHQIAGIRNQQE
ncbi:U32 family peptidase [Agarivorans sp. MS3-6]|uniref:U32 family peptidase n=1 Tax=Agarivorans sp. TSD2052 TaxID=2937286 RepID=UPI00200F9394|nr:U32 family peptidase [Agarivorans sp. TSD2052]UPW19918.1 U32 family peptidase [Agarivorans sp. TSD2052]